MLSHSVMSDSLRPHGPEPTKLLCPWKFSGKNTAVSCHFLLQRIFLSQRLSLSLLCVSCIVRLLLYDWTTWEAPRLHLILARRLRSDPSFNNIIKMNFSNLPLMFAYCGRDHYMPSHYILSFSIVK